MAIYRSEFFYWWQKTTKILIWNLWAQLAYGHDPAKVQNIKYRASWYSIDQKFCAEWLRIQKPGFWAHSWFKKWPADDLSTILYGVILLPDFIFFGSLSYKCWPKYIDYQHFHVWNWPLLTQHSAKEVRKHRIRTSFAMPTVTTFGVVCFRTTKKWKAGVVCFGTVE